MGSFKRYGTEMPSVTDPGVGVRRWWVDNDGRFLPASIIANDRPSRRRAFRHLGMVEVVQGPKSIILRWDVKNVIPAGIMTAAYFLARQPKENQISLEFFWGAWSSEPQVNAAAALARIIEIESYRNAEPFSGVRLAERPLDDVRAEGELITKAFESWDRGGSYFLPNTNDSLGTLGQYALSFKRDRSDDHLVFDYIGRASGAVRVFGGAWAETALGRPCHRSQPDYEFDDRVCAVYQRVLDTGEPVVDHVRAIIRQDGGDPAWVPYRRLVVPSRDRMGVPVVLSICDVRHDLVIPFMSA